MIAFSWAEIAEHLQKVLLLNSFLAVLNSAARSAKLLPAHAIWQEDSQEELKIP
jgi:hypothetical protein